MKYQIVYFSIQIAILQANTYLSEKNISHETTLGTSTLYSTNAVRKETNARCWNVEKKEEVVIQECRQLSRHIVDSKKSVNDTENQKHFQIKIRNLRDKFYSQNIEDACNWDFSILKLCFMWVYFLLPHMC